MSESVSVSCSPSLSVEEGNTVTVPATYSGTCSVTVKASDYADNESENTVNDAVKIDNTVPAAASFSPAAGSVNGNQVHACINGVEDLHSSLKAGYLRITGPEGERKLTSEAQGGDQICFDASFSTDGSYPCTMSRRIMPEIKPENPMRSSSLLTPPVLRSISHRFPRPSKTGMQVSPIREPVPTALPELPAPVTALTAAGPGKIWNWAKTAASPSPPRRMNG